MEDIQTEKHQGTGCVSCNHPIVSKDGPTPLCEACREKFIKFPIPLWIKIFGGCIAVIFLFAIVKLPGNLSMGIHVEKGKKAIRQKNFLTAQKELEVATKKLPGNIEAKANLMIAAFYNGDLKTMSEAWADLTEKQIEDNDLFASLQDIIARTEDYVPGDSLTALSEKYKTADSIPLKELLLFQEKEPKNVFLKELFASQFFNQENYSMCDSTLDMLLSVRNDFMPALVLKATLKREMNQFDSSFYYCDRALEINHEYTYMISSRARTLLKQHKDAEALELANKAYKMQEKDYYSLATMALVCHYTNKIKERDAYVKLAAADSTAMGYMQYPIDVIKGVEKFRD